MFWIFDVLNGILSVFNFIIEPLHLLVRTHLFVGRLNDLFEYLPSILGLS